MLFKPWCSSPDISLCLSITVYFTSVRPAKSEIQPRLGGLTTVLMSMISSTDGVCKKVPVCVRRRERGSLSHRTNIGIQSIYQPPS